MRSSMRPRPCAQGGFACRAAASPWLGTGPRNNRLPAARC
ncbi:conserved hypothetical protein [Citreicella sp. SE45]|nr:conserved hypothetical protein [Citreicella sp. SE45]